MSTELFIMLVGCFGVSGILFLSIILYNVFVEWKQKDDELDKDDLSPLKWRHWSLEEGEADDNVNKTIKRKHEFETHPLDEVIELSKKARNFKIIELGRIEMAKALNTKKETKKKPQKSLLEKRNIKKQKKNNSGE